MFYVGVLALITVGTLLAVILCQKYVGDLNVSVCIAVGAAGLYISDLTSAARSRPRTWPLLVLLADLALVCKLPPKASIFLVISGVVWLSIAYAGAVFRFGLYDIFLTDPENAPRVDCECSRPPCKWPLEDGVNSFLTGFAQKLHAQQAKMQRSIEAARKHSSP
ncbi:hypothetical protein DIPPA_24311 [Diplonema papillatum]|nr:hypothetical protein DIPPA_24311 [Diplonema papillatum]